jgi:nitrite reductase/ring-hydroxylating ferredoxin subunit
MMGDSSQKFCVGDSSDVPERGRLVVDIDGTPVGVFRVEGQLYAYENICVHQGGPACQGRIIPRVLELLDDSKQARGLAFDGSDMHVVCPWHGFEYSIKTGRHAGVDTLSLRSFPVVEEVGKVYVTV